MKLILIVFTFVSLFPAVAYSDDIYGVIQGEDRKPVGEREVTIKCEDKKTYLATTNTSGSYRVYVPVRGRCAFQVSGLSNEVEIYSYSNPQRYDFIVQGSTLRMK